MIINLEYFLICLTYFLGFRKTTQTIDTQIIIILYIYLYLEGYQRTHDFLKVYFFPSVQKGRVCTVFKYRDLVPFITGKFSTESFQFFSMCMYVPYPGVPCNGVPFVGYPVLVYPVMVYCIMVYHVIVYPVMVYRVMVYHVMVYRVLVYHVLVYNVLV